VVKAGDSFAAPPNTPHDGCVQGSQAFKVLATYVVEKSKPLDSDLLT
jgi:quercetin dioxygenase-like cupin family protein